MLMLQPSAVGIVQTTPLASPKRRVAGVAKAARPSMEARADLFGISSRSIDINHNDNSNSSHRHIYREQQFQQARLTSKVPFALSEVKARVVSGRASNLS